MGEFSIDIQVFEGNGIKRKFYDIRSDIGGELTFEQFQDFEKEAKFQIAREILSDEQKQGFSKTPVIRVDNKVGKPEELVNFLGKIEYFSGIDVSEAVLWIYEGIIKRSIVDTGTYKSKNWVLVDGSVVAKDAAQLKSYLSVNTLTEDNKIRFVNLTPYARKLELSGSKLAAIGKKKGTRDNRARTKSIKSRNVEAKIPNGAYALTAKLAKNKFPGVVEALKFVFISGKELESVLPQTRPGGGVFGTKFKSGRSFSQMGRPYVYPSIVLIFRKDGVAAGQFKL